MHAASDLTAATWRAAESLRPHPKNPRKNDGRPVEAVVSSIRRFGFVAPIVVWLEGGTVVAGHTRLKAALAILKANPKFTFPGAPAPGLVPVIEQSFASEAEAEAYLLADNRASELSGWDTKARDEVLRGLNDEGAGVLDLGWTEAEVTGMIAAGGAKEDAFFIDPSWVTTPQPVSTAPTPATFGPTPAPPAAAPAAPATGPAAGAAPAAPAASPAPGAAPAAPAETEGGNSSEAEGGGAAAAEAGAADGGVAGGNSQPEAPATAAASTAPVAVTAAGAAVMPSAPVGSHIPTLRWGRFSFTMSVESAAKLTSKLEAWEAEKGSLIGIGARLACCF